jgi:hypothetical protein
MTTTRTSRAGLAAARTPVEGRAASRRGLREVAMVAVGLAILVLVVI